VAKVSAPLNWTDKTFFCCAVTLYGIAMVYSVFLWRKGFRRDDWVVYGVLAAGLVLHTIAMAERGFNLQACPITNLYEATAFIMWTMVAGYLVVGAWQRFRFIGAFASPLLFVLGVFALIPDMDPEKVKDAHNFSGALSSLHKALLLLSFGGFGLSAVGAVMYLTQEKDLKLHKFRAILSKLPSLERLEEAMTRLVWIAFGLLTAGLITSSAYLHQVKNVWFKADPEMLWVIGVWLFYFVLLVLQKRHAQSGRRFAWGTLVSFLFVLLTFWGVYLLSPLHQASPPAT
jgi:HemX protein